jgi:hypothetical protein
MEAKKMTQINWTRFIIGGPVATVILFVTDGVLHEHLLHQDWEVVYSALGAHEATTSHGVAIAYFLIFELGRGFVSLLIYVLMRPFFGAGPKTAVLAAVVGWVAFSVTGPAQFIPLGFYSTTLWGKVAGFQLITTVVAVLAGAALYKDTAAASNE